MFSKECDVALPQKVNTNKNINVIYVLRSKHGMKDFTLVGR